jgi:hypothetical protein
MSDDDGAAEARSLGACCLKVLASIAQTDTDPDVRAFAWKELQRSLVQLRRFLVDPANSTDARSQAEATLRGFWDA